MSDEPKMTLWGEVSTLLVYAIRFCGDICWAVRNPSHLSQSSFRIFLLDEISSCSFSDLIILPHICWMDEVKYTSFNLNTFIDLAWQARHVAVYMSLPSLIRCIFYVYRHIRVKNQNACIFYLLCTKRSKNYVYFTFSKGEIRHFHLSYYRKWSAFWVIQSSIFSPQLFSATSSKAYGGFWGLVLSGAVIAFRCAGGKQNF